MLAAALSWWGAFAFRDAEASYQARSADPYRIADQGARLANVRAALPPNAVIGYISDIPADNPLSGPVFTVTAYQLAPRIIQMGDSYAVVLGNFTKPADFASVGRQHGLRVERDFGNGVVLFRREAHP